MLGANSIAILAAAIGADRRASALGMFAAAQAIGISAGPIVGGLLLGTLGWRWLFWAVVPFALVAATLGCSSCLGSRRGVRSSFRLARRAAADTRTGTARPPLNEIAAWGPGSPPFLSCAGAAVMLLVALAPAPLSPLAALFARLFFLCSAAC